MFLLAILIPACASSSPAFLMMYSAYKLNKQGENIQPNPSFYHSWLGPWVRQTLLRLNIFMYKIPIHRIICSLMKGNLLILPLPLTYMAMQILKVASRRNKKELKSSLNSYLPSFAFGIDLYQARGRGTFFFICTKAHKKTRWHKIAPLPLRTRL